MDCRSGILSLILTIEYYIKEHIDDKEMPQAVTAEKQMIDKIETCRMEIGVMLHMFFITYWRRPHNAATAAKEQSHCQRKPSSVRCSGRNMAGPSSHGSIQVQVHFGTQGLRRWGPWSTGPRRQRSDRVQLHCGVRFVIGKLPNLWNRSFRIASKLFLPASHMKLPNHAAMVWSLLFFQNPLFRGHGEADKGFSNTLENLSKTGLGLRIEISADGGFWRRIWIVRSKKLNEFWKRKKTSARSLKEQRGEILCLMYLLSTVHPLDIVYFSMFFLIFLGYR